MKNKKVMIASIFVVILLVFTFLLAKITNGSFALSNDTIITHKSITTHEKSTINFSNDENYIYFDVSLNKPVEGESYYLYSTVNMTEMWEELSGKDVLAVIEKSTDKNSYTKVNEVNLTLNKKVNLIDALKLVNNKTYYRVSLKSEGNSLKIDKRNVDLVLDVRTEIEYDFDFKEKAQEFVTPVTGSYKIELWGAAGNYYPSNMKDEVGKGAYTAGTIKLDEGQKLYVYTGKNATDEGTFYSASFNAGSVTAGRIFDAKGTPDEGYHNSSSGGGATDVRLVNGNWDDATGLRSRIMVAAGGGGTQYYRYGATETENPELLIHGIGGSGGGLIG